VNSRVFLLLSLVLLEFLPANLLARAGWGPYRIDSWQVDDGLPQSSVLSIVQARDGYLWLGTFGGLVRFDGVQFRVFTPNNSGRLPSSRILSLFEDSRSQLWIGTEEGFLARYAGNQFSVCSPQGWAKLSGYIQGFAEAQDGSLWLLNPQRELMRLPAGQAMKVGTNSEILGTNVTAIAGDGQGRIWIAAGRQIGFWERRQFVDVLKVERNEELNAVVLAGSPKGGCWVAADGRLRKLGPEGIAVDYGPFPWSKGNVVRMVEDHADQVWMGTYGSGLYCYDTSGLAHKFSTEDGLPGGFIRSLCEDCEGNIWVGMEGYGLARVKPVVFQSYGRKQGLAGDGVSSVCEGADGELWIGLIGDGLDRFQNGQIQHFGTAEGLPNDYVWSVLCSRDRRLWVGTWGGGLCRLEGRRFVPSDSPAECGGIVCALFEDSQGGIWLGQQRAKSGIVCLREGKPMVFDLASSFAGTDVRALAEGKDGSLWIGTQGDGLYRLKNGQQQHLGRAQGLNNLYIRSLCVDSDGALWIGTYGGGLNRFKDGQFGSVTTRQGLVSDALGFIAEDDFGNLWCSSLAGVFRASKADLARVADGKVSWLQCLRFTKSDGLPSVECTGGCQPSGCKTRDGRLWFPTVRGLAVVDPRAITKNRRPPPVAIERVLAEGGERSLAIEVADMETGNSPAQPLRLMPGVQRLQIQYTALSLTEPMKVCFKYRLEGLEDSWVEAGTRRSVNFSHLPPGAYRFCVQACNNDGVWNEAGASVALEVPPRFWQTWWFRGLCAFLVVAAFAGIYELRLLSERKVTRVRLRIATDLHDEIGSNLGSIALLSELCPKRSEELEEIQRVAVQTVAALRDIVWFLDPAADNLSELVARLKDTARTMLPGIPFDFAAEGEGLPLRPSLHLRRNLLPMFKEILHNAAKHSHARRVAISVKISARQMRLEIADDGVGFEAAKVRRGNGLKNLRRRTGELKGRLEVRSEPGKGARFELTVPIP
jgi:ligand-binding sensor domain-containing protein